MKRLWAAGALAAAICGAASGHHGYAGYDRCKRFTVAGEIERISWANPHVVFTLRVDDSTSYLVQWLSVEALARTGVKVGALGAGDRIVVSGSANRDPRIHIVTLLTDVERPRDGWEWSRPLPPPAQCRD